MHSAPTDADPHRQRIDALVQRWLSERQALIVLMLGLTDEQRRRADPLPLPERLQTFCEVLMDYLSAGHFEVYEELLKEAERRGRNGLAAGQALLARLQPTTDAAIRFNDIYEDPEDEEVLADLPRELSALGLALENRFEIEDRMIALLHQPAGAVAG